MGQPEIASIPMTSALTRAARVLAARAERVLAPHGFTFDQWLVADALAREEDLSMAQLAERTQLTGPTLSRVVDRLATSALLYRQVDPADRRRAVVRLGPRGRAAYAAALADLAELERELLGELGEVPELLSRLAGNG
ncbi:MarR family transcriptional regulator [Sciscionella sediminilitoris]|uniref:MarR family transcriptional regulator n=1 Tax=Sciscionella sediminilitoris TaxID=1445613 RepID=UPI0004DFC981|nr:MarR family transcriptional regulator [Sciscionella sp. SE31]